jgi:hypothetical protein
MKIKFLKKIKMDLIPLLPRQHILSKRKRFHRPDIIAPSAFQIAFETSFYHLPTSSETESDSTSRHRPTLV